MPTNALNECTQVIKAPANMKEHSTMWRDLILRIAMSGAFLEAETEAAATERMNNCALMNRLNRSFGSCS